VATSCKAQGSLVTASWVRSNINTLQMLWVCD
jgi:hypothetical protein